MSIRILVGSKDKPLHADGNNYCAGDVVDESKFDKGTLESMLNVGNAERIPEPRQPEGLRKDLPSQQGQQQPAKK